MRANTQQQPVSECDAEQEGLHRLKVKDRGLIQMKTAEDRTGAVPAVAQALLHCRWAAENRLQGEPEEECAFVHRGPFESFGRSLIRNLREIVFGVEDGLIATFGLVIGMAAGADSSFVVLLAGATAAVTSAVSMSAGTYLSVRSEQGWAQKELADEAEQLKNNPEQEKREIEDFLRRHRFTEEEVATFVAAASRSPGLMLEFMAAHELESSHAVEAQPARRAAWMFVADLIAALFPVVPFALLALDEARLASIALTATVLVALGIGRGLVTQSGPAAAVLETLVVAAIAAGAGFLIAEAISTWLGIQVPV